MSSLESNKVAGAFLGALLLGISLTVLSDELFSHPRHAAGSHAAVAGPDAREAAQAGPETATLPLPDRLASADADKGAAGTRACQACHTFGKDGAAKSGPPLYGVVERRIGSVQGFAYSEAIKAKSGNWTFEALDHFLANPKTYASGTKMTYSGERDAARRADLIAYLDSLSDHPRSLPGKNAMRRAE